MSDIINQNHIESIHIQVRSIIRYFSSSIFAEEASAKIYKLIRKITGVRQLNQLTIGQYNTVMHHLDRLEHAAYLYYLAVSFLDRALLKQVLERHVIINTAEYKREEFSAERLEETREKAKSMINLTRLFF